jgi:hypothetical protein
MRTSFAAAGLSFLTLLATLDVAPAQQNPPQSQIQASAPVWCGFVDKMGSRVRCGYSTITECKDRIGDKATVCIPNPSFAMLDRQRPPAG